jgi:5-methylcytosine-specific restriction enzyme A
MSERPAYVEWYSSHRWRKYRRRPQLQAQPTCEWCAKRGVLTVATTVHHAERHEGDYEKFWNGRLVSLCAECHNIDAQRIERGGKGRPTIGLDGLPIDIPRGAFD